MFDIAFVQDFDDQIQILRSFTSLFGTYFKILALVESYNMLIKFVSERTQTHPEVVRVPELRDILLDHLYTNADDHIDIAAESIFNIHIVGTDSTVRHWQEVGYPMKRTPKNYSKRLEYWKAIYTGEAVKVNERQKKEKNHKMSPRTGENIFGPVVEYNKPVAYEVHVKDRSGKIVTYEDVIKSRNEKFSATKKLVPFWIPLNYGTDSGVQAGYPAVPGLHFVEDAERTIPSNIAKYAALFELFMVDMLDNYEKINSDGFSAVEQWSKRHIHIDDAGIDAFDFAREHTYGVPF